VLNLTVQDEKGEYLFVRTSLLTFFQDNNYVVRNHIGYLTVHLEIGREEASVIANSAP